VFARSDAFSHFFILHKQVKYKLFLHSELGKCQQDNKSDKNTGCINGIFPYMYLYNILNNKIIFSGALSIIGFRRSKNFTFILSVPHHRK